jgi:hypothetical protein
MPISEFLAKLRNQELEDAKLIIAAQWLRDRRATLPVEDQGVAIPEQYYVAPSTRSSWRSGARKIIGYMSGDILTVKGVDVWVNPLNTDMMLDRFTDRTVSAVIRTHGAEKFPGTKRVKYDTIGEELRAAVGNRNFVKPAKVIDTGSGQLRSTHDVKRIFHVATSKGEIGEDVNTDLETIGLCVENVLTAVEQTGRYKSILIPMLGAGEDGIPVNKVAPHLFQGAISFFRARPRARLQCIYFLAYSEIDKDVVADVAAMLCKEKLLEPMPRA